MKRGVFFILTLMLLSYVLSPMSIPADIGHGTSDSGPFPIPDEDVKCVKQVWMDSAGIMHISYDLDRDGVSEFEALRRKTIFKLLEDQTVVIIRDSFGNPEPRWERFPFIYYVDINRNGVYDSDEMFLDRESDGINGNEVYLLPEMGDE